MVKLTLLGRVRDGLALATSPCHTNRATATAAASHLSSSYSYYNRQAEFILMEVSRGALPSPKTTIWLDHQHSFHFSVANGMCFMTMCETSYPRRLAFYYLQDLQTEIEKLQDGTVEKVRKPYSLVKFGDVIDRVRKRYIDTRTRANLSKLSSKRRDEEKSEKIASEIFSSILERRRQQGTLQREMAPHLASPVRNSPLLEAIALRWTPITLVVAVVTVLVWASFIMEDYLVLNS